MSLKYLDDSIDRNGDPKYHNDNTNKNNNKGDCIGEANGNREMIIMIIRTVMKYDHMNLKNNDDGNNSHRNEKKNRQ